MKRRTVYWVGDEGQAFKGMMKCHAKTLYRAAQRLQKKVAGLQQVKKSKSASFAAAKRLSQNVKWREFIERMTPTQQKFFGNQIRNVERKFKGRSFKFEEKADAIVIWKNCPKTYKLLSSFFAMPSISTLQATLDQIPIKPGISKPIFKVLKRRVRQMNDPKNKLCILIFDEIAVKPHLNYSASTPREKIADRVCVFMLRGIVERWKQPVAFVFYKSPVAAANIVRFYEQIVREATAVGLKVIASVCNQSSTNVAALDMLLDETRRNASFKGERVSGNAIKIDDQTVIPLFDPPHLLKSLRNILMTKNVTFIYNNVEKVAQWQHIQEAYQLDQAREFRLWGKITQDHVQPSAIKKMKVNLAAQVFSRIVGCSLLHGYLERPSSGNPKHTGELCCVLNSIFDSVNGGFERFPGTELQQMVDMYTSHQEWWLKGKRMFSGMKFIPSKAGDHSRPPVLDGWYRTLEGFLTIKETLRKLGCKLFPARAFNQDPLENFFDQMRQHGGRYTNPTCRSFVSFYKASLIKKFSAYHSTGSNCEQDNDSVLVTVRDLLSQERTIQQNDEDC